MNLEQFAKKAGVELVPCDPKEWNGSLGYRTADYPNTTICGFRTPRAAYKHWAESTFGKKAAGAVLDLLEDAR